ncbi:hypothetical protein BS78_03G247100 [Paspalum vaginatum]|nr:hypothetical protein BS78_03G247100 [Paspalum vaginatum]
MARVPRRLRNLNLGMQDEEPMQDGGENLTDNENEDNLQGPLDIDNILARIPQQPTRPNGEKRKVVGSFGIANLLELEGGKVMVGTDENGVPNERSASILGQHLGYLAESPTFAPLHLPRWDNELFKSHKELIIKDVEDASFEELQRRKEQNDGNLSSKDFNEVFNEVVATQLKARGYYDDKYWSQIQVSQGITFVNQTEEDRRYQDKVNAMENKMQHMNGLMNRWLAFMSQKFPEDDWIKEMDTSLNDEVSLYWSSKCS